MTALTSPTVAIVFCLDLGYDLAYKLKVARKIFTIVVVLSSNICFATPRSDSILVACISAGKYECARVVKFGILLQVTLTFVVCIGVHFTANSSLLPACYSAALNVA